MISTTLSIRSTGAAPNRSRHLGFSLVEVLMSVVLLAIGAALAIPSYRDMVEKRQVTNGAEQVSSFINTAQGIAMKTNEVITVSYSRTDDDDWCIGAVTGTAACDCTESNTEAADYCQIASQPFILNNSHAGDMELMHSMSGDGSYAFDPVRGVFMDMDDSLTVEMRSKSESFRLNMVVNSTGRVMLCSDDAEHGVPGYPTCPAAAEGEES